MDHIYVARFDVSYPDWREKRYFEYQELCREYDFEMQAQKTTPNERRTLGEKVFLESIHYVGSSNYTVASLNSLRGREPDSGTCLGVGYAYALGEKIYDYLGGGQIMMGKTGVGTDEQGFMVEDFDMSVNLMLGYGMTVIPGDLEHCLEQIREREQTERRA